MSKKRLEDALSAGKAIESGVALPNFFEKVEEHMTYDYEDTKFGVFTTQFSTEREMFVVGFGDGSIEILSTRTKKRELEVKKPKGPGLATTCVRFHPKQHFLFIASNASGHVHLCSRVDGSCEEIVTEPDNQIFTVSFGNDGYHFATAGSDCAVRVYDSNTAQITSKFVGYRYDKPEQMTAGHAQRIFALKYHPDHESIFITGGWDNCLKVWDCRTPDGLVRTISGPHICGDGLDIKGLQVLTASWVASDALEIYDFAMSRRLQSVPFPNEGSGQFLYSARFCENGIVVAGGSGTNSMKAIHLSSEKVLGEIFMGNHSVQTIAVVNGGRMIAVGSSGRTLKVATIA